MFRSFPRKREFRATGAGVRAPWVPAGVYPRLDRGRGRAEIRSNSISSEHALVLRFRRSHHIAAHSFANVGIKRSTRKSMILVRFLNLKFPRRLAAK